jgi:Ni/Fe-hydrogenase subunit HybB-like protein
MFLEKELPRYTFWLWVGFLLIPISVGVYFGLNVLINGLVITNMSDGTPWGLWIVFDLSFIALSAGAFSLSAVCHLLGHKSFKSLAQVAVFVGLLGYTGALICLFMDIGRPDRFWHGWVFWNIHSMLWEVTMCITLYFTVLVFEVFPLVIELSFFERWPWLQKIAHRIHKFAPILAILGLCLSLLHQSSLGGTYGVVIGRTHLFRATIPLLFIVSAVAGGMAFTIHITLVMQWLKRRFIVSTRVLFEAGQIAGAILLFYLYMRFWDTTAGNYGYVPGTSEAFTALMAGTFAVTFWTWEIVLGGILAAYLLIRAHNYQSITMLLIGSGLAMFGIVANRWHTTMIAFTQPLSTNPPVADPLITHYSPAFSEWAIALGILAGLTLVFSFGMRYLPAFKGQLTPIVENTKSEMSLEPNLVTE